MTLALLALYRLGMCIPLPGTADLWRWTQLGGAPGLAGLASLPRAASRISIFGLGIMPYISASILLLLASGLSPGLRRLRDANGPEHARFVTVLLASTCVLALIQGSGIAIFCDSLRTTLSPDRPAPPLSFRLVIMLTLAAGALISTWIAHAITRHGLGNGVPLLILGQFAADLWENGQATFFSKQPDRASPIVAVGIFLIAILLVIVLITARRTFTLAVSDPSRVDGKTDLPSIVLRLQPAGSAPLAVAFSLLASFLAVLRTRSDGVWPGLMGGLGTTLFVLVVTVVFSILYASWIFGSRGLYERLASRRLVPVDSQGRPMDRAELERVQERATLLGTSLLCFYAVLCILIARSDSLMQSLAGMVDATLIVAVAVALQVVANIRRWRAAGGNSPWSLAARFEVGLDAELARHSLEAEGIPTLVHNSNPGILAGSFAPWECCRPHFPALVIYGRLGGGGAEVWVPSDRVTEAERSLEIT